MSDYENRWRTGRDRDDERYAHGDVDRELRESRRRLEQAGDYDPDMLDDMRRFSGEDRGSYRGSRYERDYRESEGYTGSGGQGRDYGRDYGRTDYGRTGYQRDSGSYGARDRNERGTWDRATDEVSSWFGDDDAERRRHEDRVRDYRGRGPRGYTRSDARIREDVNDRLTDDAYVDASDIEVTVDSCEVTLSGTVDSRSARRRAEDIAESVSGVRHVQNNLRVQQRSHTGTGTGTATTGGASAMAGLGGGGTATGSGGTDATGTAWTSGTDTTTRR